MNQEKRWTPDELDKLLESAVNDGSATRDGAKVIRRKAHGFPMEQWHGSDRGWLTIESGNWLRGTEIAFGPIIANSAAIPKIQSGMMPWEDYRTLSQVLQEPHSLAQEASQTVPQLQARIRELEKESAVLKSDNEKLTKQREGAKLWIDKLIEQYDWVKPTDK